MKSLQRYDYIITGAGLAGLSLAVHMIRSGKFAGKRVLIVDQDPKRSNDRTWCFWEQQPGVFEEVVYRQWEGLSFYGENYSDQLSIAPYRYKMIRGIDFYRYSIDLIRRQSNFEIRYERVDHVFSSNVTGIIIGGEAILCGYVFNSILFKKPELSKKQIWLLQHFKGWTIETPQKAFDPEAATLMDFRTDQQWGTAFCYVLPLSETKALVEYTLFSPSLLQQEQYNEGLKKYIGEVLGLSEYRVEDEEFGIIPMTNYRFRRRKKNIINIGTAGGQTKGSSGYTFRFVQKHSAALVDRLVTKGDPYLPGPSFRFSFYDSVLLHILQHRTLEGKFIFTELFKKNRASDVLRFLDNETSLAGELKIISTLPTLPFLKAAVKQVF